MHGHDRSAGLWKLKRNSVHKVSHQEDSSPRRLQEILGRQRVGEGIQVEAGPLVRDPNSELTRAEPRLDRYPLGWVELGAGLNRVGCRLARRERGV